MTSDVKEAIAVLLDYVERHNKQDEELEAAEAVEIVAYYLESQNSV